MTPIVFWLALACGVDAGYEPAPDGQLEYIIQIEPHSVAALAAGRNMSSEVPRGLDIRHYRLMIGTATLPKIVAAAGDMSDDGAQQTTDPLDTSGRLGETVGTAMYQNLASGGGQFVIEIDPSSLADLKEHDLTGDLPPGKTITRFVISTNADTVLRAVPSRLAAGATATQAGRQPIVPAAATTDEDPSNWEAQPATAPAGTGAMPPASGAPATISTAAAPGGTRTIAAGSGTPTPAPPYSPPLADEDPGGSEKPPPAIGPPASAQIDPPATSPLLGQPTPAPNQLQPQGGEFQQGGAAANPQENGLRYGGITGGAPAKLSGGGSGAASNSGGYNRPESHHDQYGNGSTNPPPSKTNEKLDDPPAEKHPDGANHKAAAAQPVPYLPLAVVTFCLLFSIGVNVYLGWHVLEGYLRGRTAEHLPREEERRPKHERKASMAH